MLALWPPQQRVLVQRHTNANTKKKAQQQIRRYDTSDALERFDNFQQRIDRMEADAELVNYGRKATLADEFKALETDTELEKELAALKARKSGDTTTV